jgi:hypothetical protein
MLFLLARHFFIYTRCQRINLIVPLGMCFFWSSGLTTVLDGLESGQILGKYTSLLPKCDVVSCCFLGRVVLIF